METIEVLAGAANGEHDRSHQAWGDKSRNEDGTTRNGGMPLHPCNYLISLDEEPIYLTEIKTMTEPNPNYRFTHGDFKITYFPRFAPEVPATLKKKKVGVYHIGQDLIRMRVWVYSYRWWKEVSSQQNPELKWLFRNSTLDEKLFAVAGAHPGLPFRFTIKFAEYSDMLKAKAKAAGHTDIFAPFVSYQRSRAKWEEYKDIQVVPEKYNQDRTDLEKLGAYADANDIPRI